AVSKIENGQRRVDVDDVVAIALALEVSPNSILLTEGADAYSSVQMTPAVAMSEEQAWVWATQDNPLRDFDFDFFLSFSGAERDTARWLASRLLSHGYRIFYDEMVDLWGKDLSTTFHRAIGRSAYVIVLMSPDYVGSQSASHELRSATARNVAR